MKRKRTIQDKEIEAHWNQIEQAYLKTLPPRVKQSVLDWAAPYEECSPALQAEIRAELEKKLILLDGR